MPLRASWPLALLISCAGCDGSDAASSPPAPREQDHRDFIRAMKAIDLQYENIHEDVKAGKAADARNRVVAIRGFAEEASKLSMRASEAENRDLAFEFRKFLDAAAKLQEKPWTGGDGLQSWKQLGLACASCHELYREEKGR